MEEMLVEKVRQRTFLYDTKSPDYRGQRMRVNAWEGIGKELKIKRNFFIITNLIHKFLVHSHKLYKIKFFYMFRAQSAHHQEVNDANCTYAASRIVTL